MAKSATWLHDAICSLPPGTQAGDFRSIVNHYLASTCALPTKGTRRTFLRLERTWSREAKKGLVTPHDHNENPPPEGDTEIVRLIRERDAGGLRLLLQRHGSNVRGALRVWFRGTLSDNEVDEVLNGGCFRVWQEINSFAPERGELRTWFLIVCRNFGQQLVRRRNRNRHASLDDTIQEPPTSNGVLQPSPPHQLVDALHECIEALPDLQRAIIRADLRSSGTASAAELAKSLHTSKNSIYVTRCHARKALKKALAARGFSIEPRPTTDESQPQP